ncbi:MAG: hypothetical protein ACP5HG_17970 [Anaerolineae bacterium]
MSPWIDERKCPAMQEICLALKACANGAIQYVKDPAAPLGGRMTIYLSRCQGCGECAEACCGHAIELRE